MKGIEPYSLLMSHGERDNFPKGPFDSTLTMGIIPIWEENGRSSKHLKYFLIYLKVLEGLIPRVPFRELIHQPNSGFCRGNYNLPSR